MIHIFYCALSVVRSTSCDQLSLRFFELSVSNLILGMKKLDLRGTGYLPKDRQLERGRVRVSTQASLVPGRGSGFYTLPIMRLCFCTSWQPFHLLWSLSVLNSNLDTETQTDIGWIISFFDQDVAQEIYRWAWPFFPLEFQLCLHISPLRLITMITTTAWWHEYFSYSFSSYYNITSACCASVTMPGIVTYAISISLL
jgi:hypothetical protein